MSGFKQSESENGDWKSSLDIEQRTILLPKSEQIMDQIPKNENQVFRQDFPEQPTKPRRMSNQSLVGNVLHLFVEDVKVELKVITQADKDKKRNKEATIENGGDSIDKKLEETEKKIEQVGWRRYLGIIFGLSASMTFALAVLIVKIMPEYHPYNVSWWRFQGILIPGVVVMLYIVTIKKEAIFDTVWPVTKPGHPKILFLILLRAAFGTAAVVLQFYSLQFISIADSAVIAFSTPVFVSLAAQCCLGEKSGFIPILCGVITLGGVIVITRPPMLTGGDGFDSDTLIGSGLAFACMFCAASTFILLRYLRHVHWIVVSVCFGAWGTVQSVAMAASISHFQLPIGRDHWLLGVAQAILTFFGVAFMTLAFKYEQAGPVSLCRTCDILFAFLWQFIFLGVTPDMYSIIGGAVVISGVLIAAMRKMVSELPEDSPARKRFWILLK